VFHLELRQFPHVARSFNLTRDELEARILSPWTRGQAVELEDRRWSPERAKLTIYEGRQLASAEIGLGRGWATASRDGQDVTATLLAELESRGGPTAGEAKPRLLGTLARGPVELVRVPELVTGEEVPRPSQRLVLAEQAVWELLHEGRIRLTRGGRVLDPGEWQATLLTWSAWTESGGSGVTVEAAGS
jgi:hypothetical protein